MYMHAEKNPISCLNLSLGSGYSTSTMARGEQAVFVELKHQIESEVAKGKWLCGVPRLVD